MRLHIASLLVFLVVITGCSPSGPPSADRVRSSVINPTAAGEIDRPCDIPVAEGIILTPVEECILDLYKTRCSENDVCIVDCIANAKDWFRTEDGAGGRIAGGCWHVCYAYTGIEWTTPDGFEDCREVASGDE
jgi:hypothetical protein